MKMRLSHKIIAGFTVLVLLSGVFGSLVFYLSLENLSASLLTASPELTRSLGQAQTTAVLIGILSVVLGTVIAFVLVKQVVTPIRALIMGLEEHLQSGRAISVLIPNRDELGVLAILVNRLMEKEG